MMQTYYNVSGILLSVNRPLAFTVACPVASPLNESEDAGDLPLIETSLHFLC